MSFTVVCNSLNGTGASTSSLQYNFDWSKFEDGPYKLTFQFVSQPSTLNGIYFINTPELGSCLNSYTAGTSTTAMTNNYLGVVSNWNATAATGYQTNLQNLPKYVSNKPRSNTFTINTTDQIGSAVALTGYVLILNFEKV